MNDRELLEMAARAAGLEVVTPTMLDHNQWNPLSDDGDALRLAVHLRLAVSFRQENDTDFVVAYDVGDYHGWIMQIDQDPCATTRRAITRAAAEIGRAMTTESVR